MLGKPHPFCVSVSAALSPISLPSLSYCTPSLHACTLPVSVSTTWCCTPLHAANASAWPCSTGLCHVFLCAVFGHVCYQLFPCHILCCSVTCASPLTCFVFGCGVCVSAPPFPIHVVQSCHGSRLLQVQEGESPHEMEMEKEKDEAPAAQAQENEKQGQIDARP